MPELSLNIKYSYCDELQISSAELINDWMFGIPMKDSGGNAISEDSILKKIKAAQLIIENLLGVCMFPKIVSEKLDYIAEEFASWGHTKVKFPISNLYHNESDITDTPMMGFYGERHVFSVPKDWLSFSERNLAVVPGVQGASSIVMMASGSTYPSFIRGQRYIPDFWRVKYISGFREIPADIEAVICKLAVIFVFAIIGDVIRPIGVSSQSLSIDGLSQSVSTVMNSQGNLLSPRLNQYYKELFDMNNGQIQYLINNYRGISFQTC